MKRDIVHIHKLSRWFLSRFCLLSLTLVMIPSLAHTKSMAPEDTFEISAKNGYLVGGAGNTGDSFRYGGSKVMEGVGTAIINVNEKTNDGLVTGGVTVDGNTYMIVIKEFAGNNAFKDGGIARDLYLHGLSGHGPPVLPKVWTFLAGWGKADIYQNGKLMFPDYHSHFMLTFGTRDKETRAVRNFDGPQDLINAQKTGNEEEIREEKSDIQKAAKDIDTTTMQLHIVAHSHDKNPEHFPPYDRFFHFMWDQVTWH